MTYHGDRVWQRGELATGVWISPAVKMSGGGYREVGPRRFVAFDFDKPDFLGMVPGRRRVVFEEYSDEEVFGGVTGSFDYIAVSAHPAGVPVEYLYNGRTRMPVAGLSVWMTWHAPRPRR